ncbi:MAG: ubiquinone/menaquinone biosynthesis methyltransferase, partial [Alphaproteobacteria bacterium]
METGHSQDPPQDPQARRVRAVFDAVAGRYDLMNDLMSAGIHRLWKAAMIDWLAPRPGINLADIAGGTGDIAFRVIDRVGGAEANRALGGSVTVFDVNAKMLEVGRKRAKARGLGAGCRFVSADAESLPMADSSVDAYTVAFGLRNVSHMDLALSEARRVLKPGGRFLCLEFSRVAVPLLGELYDRYSFTVLPRLGEIVTGNGDAYRYLVESIRAFPPQDEFAAMIEAAGLERLDRRGKYLLARLDDGNVWVIHLGMSGRMVIDPPAMAD